MVSSSVSLSLSSPVVCGLATIERAPALSMVARYALCLSLYPHNPIDSIFCLGAVTECIAQLKSEVRNLRQLPSVLRSQKQKKALAKLVASSATHERMSRSEIQSWVHAADKLGDDFDLDDDDDDTQSTPAAGLSSDPAMEWQAFLSLARRRVTQTSTRARVEFVRERLFAVAQRGGVCFHSA